jgi:hypothetical protein
VNADRRNALRGLLHGADFIPERDLAVMLGDNVTDIQTELRAMELDKLVERERRRVGFKSKPGTMVAWRLKQAQ